MFSCELRNEYCHHASYFMQNGTPPKLVRLQDCASEGAKIVHSQVLLFDFTYVYENCNSKEADT
jgi:hypothetical protein